MKRNLQTGDRLVIEFRDGKLFYTPTKSVDYIGASQFYAEFQRGTLWLVEVTKNDPISAILSVRTIQRPYTGSMPASQDEIVDVIDFIQFPWMNIEDLHNRNKQRKANLYQASSPAPPSGKGPDYLLQGKPNSIIKRFSFKVSAEIETLVFQEGLVKFLVKDCKGYGPLELVIRDERIVQAFEHIRPYIRKSLKRKTISIEAEIEVNPNLTCSCLSANSPELEFFLKDGLEKIRTGLLADQFFGNEPVNGGFKDVASLTEVVENLGEKKLNAKTLINKLQERKRAKHALELNYLAERHLEGRMKLHFLKEAMSFLFLVEGINRFHLVLEVYDMAFATYIWHCPRDHQSLEAKIKEVLGDAGMLSSGRRQEYKGSRKGAEFKAINHCYEGDPKRNFEDWKWEFERECD